MYKIMIGKGSQPRQHKGYLEKRELIVSGRIGSMIQHHFLDLNLREIGFMTDSGTLYIYNQQRGEFVEVGKYTLNAAITMLLPYGENIYLEEIDHTHFEKRKEK